MTNDILLTSEPRSMSLLIGSQVTAETLGWQLTIQKKLGEGGQGVAYLASGPGGDLVVKRQSLGR